MHDHFFNRELSWLAFNDRVFAEAANPSNPLLERLRFATIVASNLDEFFMVRVAALKNAIYEGDTRPDDSGMTPSQQLEAVSERANTMLVDLHTLVWDALVPALAEHGILIRRLSDLSAAEHEQKVSEIRVTEDGGAWVIDLEGRGDLTMERLAATSRADLLVDVFGKQVVIRGAGASL